MDLLDNLPHTIDVKTSSSAADAAGGHATTYTAGQSGVRCSINPTGSNTSTLFSQEQIHHTASIGLPTANLSATVKRGDKVVGSNGYEYHVEGIADGLAYDDCPAITYIQGTALR